MSRREKVGTAVLAVLIAVVTTGWSSNERSASPAGAAGPAPGAGVAAGEARAITGIGTGRVRGTPDTMMITIGVETRGRSAEEGLARNRERATEVLEALRKAGVEQEDVQTSRLAVMPVHDDDRSRIVGYEVSNLVVATLRDLDQAGEVIDAAADAAADTVRVSGVRFFIEDTNALVAAARADAVERAGVQAEQLARAAGVTLGEVLSIEETTTSAGPPLDLDESRPAEDAGAATTPIEPGSQELTVDVVVRYSIV